MFEPAGRMPRLSDTVAEQLVEAIIAGRLQEGDTLPSERELGDQFGVSRTVIREAIRTLTTRGLVDVQSGRGVQVVRPDIGPVTAAVSLLLRSTKATTFSKLHEVRTMLEGHIAELAAERGQSSDYEELEGILADLKDAGDDVDTGAELDLEFHRAIARSTRNELFEVLLDTIASSLLDQRRAILTMPHSPQKVLDEHRAILNAIKDRDPAAARSAMETHLANAAKAWSLHADSHTGNGEGEDEGEEA